MFLWLSVGVRHGGNQRKTIRPLGLCWHKRPLLFDMTLYLKDTEEVYEFEPIRVPA